MADRAPEPLPALAALDPAGSFAARHIGPRPDETQAMLAAVGHPTAVNPDRALRRAAAEHAWPVLQFTWPVTMRSRFPVPSAPVVTGAAMSVGAAVVGLASWLLTERRAPAPRHA